MVIKKLEIEGKIKEIKNRTMKIKGHSRCQSVLKFESKN